MTSVHFPAATSPAAPAPALEPLARLWDELVLLREQLARDAFDAYGEMVDEAASEGDRERASARHATFQARLARVDVDMDKLALRIRRTGEFLAMAG